MKTYKMTEEQKNGLQAYVSDNLLCKQGNPILNLLAQLPEIKEEEQEEE